MRQCLPSRHFLSVFPINTPYPVLFSLTRATRPAEFILVRLITLIIFVISAKSHSPLLYNCLHCHATSKRLDPNIFLSTLFSNIFGVFSSFNMKDQVLGPYKILNKYQRFYFQKKGFLINNFKTIRTLFSN